MAMKSSSKPGTDRRLITACGRYVDSLMGFAVKHFRGTLAMIFRSEINHIGRNGGGVTGAVSGRNH